MDDVIDVLERTLEKKKLALNHRGAVLIENVRRDDDIRNAGFVFEADEDETFGCAGALARNHTAGHTDITPIRSVREIDGAEYAKTIQPLAAIGHRVRTDRHAGAVEVGNETLFMGHDVERRGFVFNFDVFQ